MEDEHYKRFLRDVNENINIVHKVCRIYFSGEFVAEREDVFQEIMYQLWKSYPQFKGDAKFSTWMYRVALNTAVTHVRKSIRAPAKDKLADRHLGVANPPESHAHEEQLTQLYQTIETLSSLNKAIILLYLDEHNYDEIASITGLTKNNVSVRLVRIKKALEDKMKKHH